MCGIIGYIGKKTVDVELVKLLKNLEYRGYDSSGVAVQCGKNIETTKSVGKISNLENILKKNKTAKCGIAHTRWATHGKATTINAHPHLSNDNKWAIVHNGIIENFAELKKELLKKKISFKSETDTEVIANLLQVEQTCDKIETLINTCQKLKGSYALACLNSDEKNTLFLAKKKSPLYITKTNHEIIVASDPICFTEKTTDYYSLNDDEFCKATQNDIVFYDKNKNIIKKSTQKISDFNLNINKKEYPYYMLKEIDETPEVLSRIVKTYTDNNILKKFNKRFLKKYNKVILVGCGTAYHASLVGARFIEDFSHIPCSTYIASEFRYQNPIINDKTLCILVSQSGETADTLAASELAKQKGATTIALTNVLYSTLAKKVDIVLPVCAGPEIAVASTKAYTAQITVFYMLATKFKNVLLNRRINYIKHIENLALNLKMPNIEEIKKMAKELSKENKVFFIGRNTDYLTCEEASLKLKEISYINCSSHPAGELKHGFLALIESDTYVFVLATKKELLDKTLNGAHEALSRGAKIILISNLKLPQEKYKDFYAFIPLQNFKESLMPSVSVIFFQLLAYYTSINKGLNPDQPRNLAKSVTVE